MKTSIIKKSVLTVAGVLTFASASVIASDYARIQKELKIMSTIFETSLTEQSNETTRIHGSKKTNATYLAKQGMVFTFSFGKNIFSDSNDWQQFGEGIGNLVGTIASEVGTALSDIQLDIPEPPVAPSVTFDYESQFDAYQERMEALEAMREQHREQREQVRELQREIRSLERQRDRDEDEKHQIAKVKEELEQKLGSLNKRMDEYKQSMKKYREVRDQKFIASTKLKSDVIISTLCDYGGTLRSLKKDEYVTLIFSNYAKNKDQVYVFEYSDINDCTSKEKLLKRAISYQL